MKKKVLFLLTVFFSAALINVNAQTVNAGPDQTIKAGMSALLKGKARGVNCVSWESTGTGIFSRKYNLKTFYKPSSKDIANGMATLTLRDRKRKTVKDEMLLKIITCPTVNIVKEADTICGSDRGGNYEVSALVTGSNYSIKWTSDGTGFFYDDTAAVPGFEYSVSDAGRGYVNFFIEVTDTLNKCAPVYDTFSLKLNDPARININQGFNFECGNAPVFVNGDISGTASTVTWSTTGTGYFAENPAATTFYYPSLQDRLNGGFSFSGVTNDPEGPCSAVSGGGYFEFIGPVVDAGPDITICGTRYGGSVPVSATTYNGYQTIWSTNGTGYFDDTTSTYTNYNFTADDVNQAQIYLFITVTGNCDPYTDTVKLNLREAPYLQFPNPYVSACSEDPRVSVEVYPYGYYSNGTWSTSGTGTFDDSSSTYTGYTASAKDVANGCVNLTFSTNPSGLCSTASGSVTACFYPCSLTQSSGRVANKSLSHQNKLGSAILYPNPAKDVLYINNNKANIDKNKYSITDVVGKSIPCKWSGNNSLNISGLSSGTYFLVIVSGNQKQTIKFIKQ